jgi:hypothetical protein
VKSLKHLVHEMVVAPTRAEIRKQVPRPTWYTVQNHLTFRPHQQVVVEGWGAVYHEANERTERFSA